MHMTYNVVPMVGECIFVVVTLENGVYCVGCSRHYCYVSVSYGIEVNAFGAIGYYLLLCYILLVDTVITMFTFESGVNLLTTLAY